MAACDPLRTVLAEQGMNLWGVVSGVVYDDRVPPAFRRSAVAPDAQSAVVLGNGGRAMWSAIARAPERDRAHRINAYCERVIRQAVGEHLPGAALLWPWTTAHGAYVPFTRLAEAAGLGVPSRMMMLIHPTFGLWTGLRAVALADAVLEPTQPPLEFDPCATCHAPCASACHGGALRSGVFDIDRCLRSRIVHSACRRTCDARLACPVGVEHRYSIEQMAHHTKHLVRNPAFARYAIGRLRPRVSS